jgi:polyhydroxyalkanoate synthesis regulator phasin
VPVNEPENGDPLERLALLLGPRLDEARALVEDLTARWRGDALRVGESTRRRVHDLAREVGLVTRDEWDELELRIAQLEHRLRLIEDAQQK